MKKVKILRIIARLNIGGPAIHAVLLSDGLDKNNFETLLVTGSIEDSEGDMSDYAYGKNVRPYLISELRREINFFYDIAALKKIYRIIQNEKPDIIHTHTAKAGTLGRSAGIFYNLLNRDKQIKLIHTFHGHVFLGYFNKIKTKLFIYIERVLSIFTSKIIAVSESIKRDLIGLKIAKEAKIVVVPLGLELDEFLNLPPKNHGNINIGIIGRLVPIKNHRLFLEAARDILRYPLQDKLRFKIIGNGELSDELKAYAGRLGIAERVDFLGWQRNLAQVYADLDIVVLTSINEGTPVSLIEAMAAGRPVVATDAGGVRDLLGDSRGIKADADFEILERGILVKSADAATFAKAVIFILEDYNLRDSLINAAQTYVKAAFIKNRLIRDMEKLYRDILVCA